MVLSGITIGEKPLKDHLEATERWQLKIEDSQVKNEEHFKLILDAMQDKKFPPQKEIKCCQCDNVANYQVQFPMLRAA